VRVLQIHTNYRDLGGEGLVVDTEAGLLRAEGHDVYQFTAQNRNSAPQSAAALAVAPWNPAQVRKLRQVVGEFKPDIAHVHNTWYAMSPAVISTVKHLGVPVVMTLHNYRLVCANGMLFRDGSPCEDCVGSSPWQGVRHSCYRGSTALSVVAVGTRVLHDRLGTYADVDVFVALTDFQRDVLVRGGLPRDRVVVKPNVVSDPGPRPAPPSRSNTVLYVGRLAEEKGVDVLIDGWTRDAPPGMELVIAGDGPLRPSLERAATASSIEFVGSVAPEGVQELMLTSRALVFPSKVYESFGMVVVEAFAAGLPALVTRGGAAAELAAELGGEWLINSDPGSWPGALRRLTDGTVDKVGRRARRIYEDRFAAQAGIESLLAAYEWATRTHTERSS